MSATPDIADRPAVVARLCEAAQRIADHIVPRAWAAHRLGARAETYRVNAFELERQADRAEGLLFGQAVRTFRAAAAENRFMADALDGIESMMPS